MPDRLIVQDKQFVGWILGITGALFISAISVIGVMLFNGNAAIAVMGAELKQVKEQLVDVQSSLTKVGAERYSGADATRDRAALMELMSKMVERNNQQDTEIMSVSRSVARLEAALEAKKP